MVVLKLSIYIQKEESGAMIVCLLQRFSKVASRYIQCIYRELFTKLLNIYILKNTLYTTALLLASKISHIH
jgi:hypothetical protein